MAGTIFVNRAGRRKIRIQLEALVEPLVAGLPVVLFPEGTSSDGSCVLPFRSALLESALTTENRITPCALAYAAEDGDDPAQGICYWGDRVFAIHLVHLLARRGFSTRLHFGEGRRASANRKTEAAELHAHIGFLLNGMSGARNSTG